MKNNFIFDMMDFNLQKSQIKKVLGISGQEKSGKTLLLREL